MSPRFSEKPTPSDFLVKQIFSWDTHIVHISIPAASLQGQRAGHTPFSSVPVTSLCPEITAGTLLCSVPSVCRSVPTVCCPVTTVFRSVCVWNGSCLGADFGLSSSLFSLRQHVGVSVLIRCRPRQEAPEQTSGRGSELHCAFPVGALPVLGHGRVEIWKFLSAARNVSRKSEL